VQRQRSGRVVTHARDDRSNKLNASAQLRQFCPSQFLNRTDEPRDATRASGGENLMTFRGRFDVRQPSIPRVTFPLYEIILLETRHYPRHRRRPHLLGTRESAERKRTTENDDGERREAGSRKSAGVIFFAQLPQ
jgi:hypothetical protein